MDKKKLDWTEQEIDDLVMHHLYQMFDCRTTEGVDVTLKFARFMSKQTSDPDNYPVFFKLLESGNHWVIDALLGGKKPEELFKPIQPNGFMLAKCLAMLRKWKPGGIYPPLLVVLLEILRVCFEDPEVGYRMYPLDTNNINSIGKHLRENEKYDSPVNFRILHIFDRISSLTRPGGLPAQSKQVEEISVHANSIRGKFLDPQKHLREAIPVEVLAAGDYTKNEIAPSA